MGLLRQSKSKLLRVHGSGASTSIAGATDTTIIYNTIATQSPDVTYNTSTGQFTVQRNGIYLVTSSILMDAAPSSRLYSYVSATNNTWLGDIHGSVGGTQFASTGSVPLEFPAGQVFIIRARISVASTVYNNADYTYCRVLRIG